MKKPQLTQERLKQLFRYDPETGLFTRLVSTNNRVKVGDVAGNSRADGYIKIRVDFDMHYAHRLAWLYMTGEWPAMKIDHVNGDKSDNRWSNLRDVSTTVNSQNVEPRDGAIPRGGKWHSRIMVNGKTIELGTYSEKWRASAAYLTAKLLCHPEAGFCHGLEADISCFSPTAIKNLTAAGYLPQNSCQAAS